MRRSVSPSAALDEQGGAVPGIRRRRRESSSARLGPSGGGPAPVLPRGALGAAPKYRGRRADVGKTEENGSEPAMGPMPQEGWIPLHWGGLNGLVWTAISWGNYW